MYGSETNGQLHTDKDGFTNLSLFKEFIHLIDFYCMVRITYSSLCCSVLNVLFLPILFILM